MKTDRLSASEIRQIAWKIRDGKATPEQAKQLMSEFCNYVDDNIQPPIELFRHFRDAFDAIISGAYKAERALGLTRRKSRPSADQDIRFGMAHEILKCRLNGQSHQSALAAVSDKYGWGITIVGEAWAQNKMMALILERNTRPHDRYPWTEEEFASLQEIFKHDAWFLTPGK